MLTIVILKVYFYFVLDFECFEYGKIWHVSCQLFGKTYYIFLFKVIFIKYIWHAFDKVQIKVRNFLVYLSSAICYNFVKD